MAKRGGRSGRKYVRDNRGRFATTGATARGGRLKTKSGKKRATQTVKAKTGGKPAGAIKGKIKRDPGAAKPAAAKPAAAKTKLKRSGEKIGVGRLTTNKEQGRKGIVSMSSQAKAARKGAVAERKSEKMSRIAERQSEIVARRQGRRASNYNPDGTFNQSTANANQRRLGRSKQLQEKLRYAGGGKNIASKALSKRRKAKPAAAKPAAAKRKTVNTSGASFERRRALAAPKVAANRRLKAEASRPLQFSGKKAGGKADQLFNDKVAQASYNRQRASEGVAARARRFYDGASQFYSAFSDRPRYSTIRKPAKDAGQWSSSSQSAWSNDLRKRRTGKRRFG